MKKRPSIAWRLALGLTLGTALLWIGASAIALSVLRAELTDSFDETLRQTALRLLPLAVHDFDEPGERNEYRVSSLDAENQFFPTMCRTPRVAHCF